MSDTTMSQQYPTQLEGAEASYSSLRTTLKKLKMRSELLRYLGGLLSWLACVSLLLTGWILLGGVLRLVPAYAGMVLRLFTVAIFVGCAIWTAYIFIVKVAVKRTSIEKMAFRIEQRHPEVQDRIISSLQLWPELPENKYGYSASFVGRVVEEANASLSKIDTSEVLADDLRRFKRAIGMLAAVLPLIVTIALFPSAFRDSLYTFVHPFEGDEPPIPVEITRVVPGDCVVTPGDSVDISAYVTGPAPTIATLYHRSGSGKWNTISLSRLGERRLKPATPSAEDANDAQKAVFAAKLQNIKESLEYYVSVPRTRRPEIQSQQYSITVIQKPIISSLQLELHYPRYTGLPSQSLDVNVGDVAAPLGTRVAIEATSSKDAASAFVVFDDGKTVRLEVEELTLPTVKETAPLSPLVKGAGGIFPRKLTGGFLVQGSGRYHISITDTDGQSNADPIRYSVNALPDQPPRVSIVQPGEDITIGEDMTIPLQIQAQDDYGIAKLSLHYQIEGQVEKHIISLGSYDSPQTSVLLGHTWDLVPLRLFPEDVISYYAEAADADNISGPNIGRSPVFTARFPSLYEIYKQMEAEQQAEQLEMEDIRSRQDDVKDMVDDLIEDLKKEKELDWAGEKELEKATELQRPLQDQTKNLARQIDETAKSVEENPLISLEALEKLQELRNLMDELATDEMKQIMRKLSEALEEMNPSQQQRDLMAASFKQEEFMEKLDRMIDLFKRMQLKQKLEVAANQAEELVRQQTETLEQSEQLAKEGVVDSEDQARSETLADREMRIKRQTEQLLNDLDGLSEEMRESLPNMGNILEQVTEQAKQAQIPHDLQCASSELKDSSPSTSLPCQRNALSKLSQLQSDLQNALEAMEGQDASEIVAALRDAIRSGLYLSHRHEEVIQATMTFKGESEEMLPKEKEIMDSLAADEIDLAEGATKVAGQLKELSHRTASIRPELVWNVERVADGMNRAAAAMEDKLPALVVPIQKNTLAMLNSTIEDMLTSIDQINAQAMPMMGLEDYMEQLRQLAEQQSQLNQSTEDAENMRRKQGTTPSLEEMLEKLAIEQSLIREATERLAAKLDQLAEVMGRLEEVAREMREVEDSLRQGNLSGSTVEKQRRILTRLLDYEKSLKKQDFSRKRQAHTGREYVVEKPASVLPPDATRIRKQLDTMLSPAAQQQWPTQYKELIKMYYKALSRTIRTQGRVVR